MNKLSARDLEKMYESSKQAKLQKLANQLKKMLHENMMFPVQIKLDHPYQYEIDDLETILNLVIDDTSAFDIKQPSIDIIEIKCLSFLPRLNKLIVNFLKYLNPGPETIVSIFMILFGLSMNWQEFTKFFIPNISRNN
jgi:adenylate cyclase